jgi:NAD+ diphosphatase
MAYGEDVFSYCPRCGVRGLQAKKPGQLCCISCGLDFFLNIAAAVVGVLRDPEGRILLVRRSQEPGKGLLDIPGGFVDAGESADQALKREMQEELGIEVTDLRLIATAPNRYEYKGVTYRTLDLFFACNAQGLEQATPREEIQEILYRAPKDIVPGELAFDSVRQILPILTGGRY